MAGLIHPKSMELWNDWAMSRRSRSARPTVPGTGGQGEGGDGPGWILHSRDGESSERVLIALDDADPMSRQGLLGSLPYLRAGIDVLTPAWVRVRRRPLVGQAHHDAAAEETLQALLPELAGPGWERTPFDSPRDVARRETSAVMSLGRHLPGGAAAHVIASRLDVPEYVVQHELLTPYAPPLPVGSRLLAWSEADAEFWRSGREDVRATAVGSQMLWQAAHEERAQVAAASRSEDTGEGAALSERIVFLGEVGRAELPRRQLIQAGARYCIERGGLYRPGPEETGLAARVRHRRWRRRGIEFAPTDVPVPEITSPIVAVLSGHVLLAAARGRDAWIYLPGAPGWVHEYWARYGLHPVGADPTPPPRMPDEEPAARIARILEGTV